MTYANHNRLRLNGLARASANRHRRFGFRLWTPSVESEARKVNPLKPDGKLDVRELNRRLHRIHLFFSDGNTFAAVKLLEETIRELEQPNPIKP